MPRRSFHYAWIIAGVTFLILLVTAGIRATPGVLMVPLELIDNLVRPVSLALRLFGNMTGDHLVLEIFTDLTKLVIPVLFYMLGAFVSLIQAFVFTLLSMVYVSLAVAHHDDHHGEHHH